MYSTIAFIYANNKNYSVFLSSHSNESKHIKMQERQTKREAADLAARLKILWKVRKMHTIAISRSKLINTFHLMASRFFLLCILACKLSWEYSLNWIHLSRKRERAKQMQTTTKQQKLEHHVDISCVCVTLCAVVNLSFSCGYHCLRGLFPLAFLRMHPIECN